MAKGAPKDKRLVDGSPIQYVRADTSKFDPVVLLYDLSGSELGVSVAHGGVGIDR